MRLFLGRSHCGAAGVVVASVVVVGGSVVVVGLFFALRLSLYDIFCMRLICMENNSSRFIENSQALDAPQF